MRFIRGIIPALLIVFAFPAYAVPALVQVQTGGFSGSPTSLSITSTGSGNLIAVVVHMYVGSPGTVTSVTDSASHTYTQVSGARGTNTANNTANDIWYFPNSSSGITSVTATFTGDFLGFLSVYEVSGIALTSPVDVAGNVSNGASTSAAVTAALTTTKSNDFIIASIDQNPNITSVNSPYTIDGGSNHTAYYIPGSTVSANSATFNFSGADTYASSSAAFLAIPSVPSIGNVLIGIP